MGGVKIMIKTIIILTIAWIVVAFNYSEVVDFIDNYEVVDKTTKIVYNIWEECKKWIKI